MKTRILLVWMISTVLAATGCTVHQTAVPGLTGPSDFAKSLTVTATPDTIVLNGQQSVVIVEAHDVMGGPLANLRVHLDILVGGLPSACGRLSASELITGSDGRASSVYTAPTTPLPLPEC